MDQIDLLSHPQAASPGATFSAHLFISIANTTCLLMATETE